MANIKALCKLPNAGSTQGFVITVSPLSTIVFSSLMDLVACCQDCIKEHAVGVGVGVKNMSPTQTEAK